MFKMTFCFVLSESSINKANGIIYNVFFNLLIGESVLIVFVYGTEVAGE